MIPLRERANGRWQSILPALGIDRRFLTGRHGPCPMCGGVDRWRFDNKQGNGTWFCTHCGAGHGIKLAMLFTGQPFDELAPHIERIMGDAPREIAKQERSDASTRAGLNALWKGGRAVTAGDPVDLWFRQRGIAGRCWPGCIRYAPQVRHRGPPVTHHPAMLARFDDATGKPATIHRTYLTRDGRKAAVDPVRMFYSAVPAGGAVRLMKPGPTLGVAEGIETAFAAAQLFDVPVWACLNDGRLRAFEPPAGTRRLIVFGDNDAGGAGQSAAYELAARLASRMQIDVRIPDTADTDWNDVLLKRGTCC